MCILFTKTSGENPKPKIQNSLKLKHHPQTRASKPNLQTRYKGVCIISGTRTRSNHVLKVNFSEVTVWQQFRVDVLFNGAMQHVMASVHETVLSLRRKLCACLSIECSAFSPVLALLPAAQATATAPVGPVTLEDSKQLLGLNIINDIQLCISCPVPGFAAIAPTVQPSVAARPDPDAPLLTYTMVPGVIRGSGCLVVNIHSEDPVSILPFSFANTQDLDSNFDVSRLKQLIRLNFGIPPEMQRLSVGSASVKLGNLKSNCLLQNLSRTIDCHVQQPPCIYIRARPFDGPEQIHMVCSSATRPFTTL